MDRLTLKAQSSWSDYLAAARILDVARRFEREAQGQCKAVEALRPGERRHYLLSQCLRQLEVGAEAWREATTRAVGSAEMAATSALRDVLTCEALMRRDHGAYRELARLVQDHPRFLAEARSIITDLVANEVDDLLRALEEERAGKLDWLEWVEDVAQLVEQLRQEAA